MFWEKAKKRVKVGGGSGKDEGDEIKEAKQPKACLG